jgi:predicted nucleic acid-binding protein
MKIVIDTNILIAGLLKDSTVRRILFSKKIDFFIPEQAILEVKKYEKYLCKKAGYNDETFWFMFNSILDHINLISNFSIKPFMEQAKFIMNEIDINDSSFIAACFSVGSEGIWSFDRHFNKQEEVRVFNINEILSYLK